MCVHMASNRHTAEQGEHSERQQGRIRDWGGAVSDLLLREA